MSDIKFYFQGEQGAFSEEAGLKFFGYNSKGIPVKEFEDVVENVVKTKGRLEFCQLKIQQSVVSIQIMIYYLIRMFFIIW